MQRHQADNAGRRSGHERSGEAVHVQESGLSGTTHKEMLTETTHVPMC